MTLQPVQQRTAHHITSRSCSTLSPSALTPPLPHGHHNNWHILAVLAMAAMDSWTIHSKGTFQEGGRLSAALSCWARCRAEKAPELLCCKRCFSWCLEHSLEALKKRPNELLKLLADQVFFLMCLRLLDLFWDIKTGMTLCLASEFYSYPPAQSMSTTHCLAKRCSSRSRWAWANETKWQSVAGARNIPNNQVALNHRTERERGEWTCR